MHEKVIRASGYKMNKVEVKMKSHQLLKCQEFQFLTEAILTTYIHAKRCCMEKVKSACQLCFHQLHSCFSSESDFSPTDSLIYF